MMFIVYRQYFSLFKKYNHLNGNPFPIFHVNIISRDTVVCTWARKSLLERVAWWNLLMSRARNCLMIRLIPFTCLEPRPSPLVILPLWPLACTSLFLAFSAEAMEKVS